MSKHIHIVGLSPRSGTTLIAELINSCFNIDGYCEHESTVFSKPDRPVDIFCTKAPNQVRYMKRAMQIDPDLWCICMARDPRDVVVSRHKKHPDRYWTPLRVWHEHFQTSRSLVGHSRFIMVKYEDLVSDPDAIQQQLMAHMPFLHKQCDFSAFYKNANPSEKSLRAMNGVRKTTTSRIGNWRAHKERLQGQLAQHGPVSDELIELGYESNREWIKELDGIEADLTPSCAPEQIKLRKRIVKKYNDFTRLLRFQLGIGKPVKLIYPERKTKAES